MRGREARRRSPDRCPGADADTHAAASRPCAERGIVAISTVSFTDEGTRYSCAQNVVIWSATRQ